MLVSYNKLKLIQGMTVYYADAYLVGSADAKVGGRSCLSSVLSKRAKPQSCPAIPTLALYRAFILSA